jgi:serralysin
VPVVIDDHHGGSVTSDIVMTINGANDSPIAGSDSNGTAKHSTLSVSAKIGHDSSDFVHGEHDCDRTNGFEGYPCGVADRRDRAA